jgi:hypothetical protein
MRLARAGPRTDVGEAKLLEEFSDITWMKVHAEPLGDDTLEVEPTPAHDAVDLTIRTRLDDLRELSQLLRRKARLGTLRPVVEQSLGPGSVEAMDPVAERLAVHTADLRGAALPRRSSHRRPMTALALSQTFRHRLGRSPRQFQTPVAARVRDIFV